MVVTIIAMLISVLMPAVRQARDAAIRVKCASQLHQVGLADFSYAGDNAHIRPYRCGTYLIPQRVYSVNYYDMNATFITPYLGDRNIMFCPSRLLEVRYPGLVSPDYVSSYVTYQYHNMAGSKGSWIGSIHPDLSRIGGSRRPVAIWSCLTLSAAGLWFGHDAPHTKDPPSGMNAAWTDGSVHWTGYAQTESYWVDASMDQWYVWPKP